MELTGLSEARLTEVARALGSCLQPGDVVLLRGPMGAGKTTFTRAVAHGLGVLRPERVRSPTYTLCLEHDGPRPLTHVDLFRLAEDDPGASVGSAAFEALGLSALTDDALLDARVLIVEWADLWADPPADCLRIELRLEPNDFTRRTVEAHGSGSRSRGRVEAWQRALAPPGP